MLQSLSAFTPSAVFRRFQAPVLAAWRVPFEGQKVLFWPRSSSAQELLNDYNCCEGVFSGGTFCVGDECWSVDKVQYWKAI